MPSLDIFGPIVDTDTVEQAVLATLWPWMDTYLAETESRKNIAPGTLARPRSAQTSYDFENWREGQLPALVVVCDGTAEDMERGDGGIYAAWFAIHAGVLVEDATESDARRVASMHQASIELILAQRGGLGGLATRTRLRGRANRLPDTDNRTLAYAESTANVLVIDVANDQLGPSTANPPITPWEPYPGFPPVNETTVTFTSPIP